jgi:hypothetical protein
MKIKKWYVVLGIILASFASMDLANAPKVNSIIQLILVLIQELFLGFFNLLRLVIKFALSWQGVLLIFVILLYKSWNKYLDKKFGK